MLLRWRLASGSSTLLVFNLAVLGFTGAPSCPLSGESMLRQDVDEPADDAEPHEDVEDGEELPCRRGGSGVSKADGCQRGYGEVEGVQYAPSLHKGEEDRPAQQEGDHKGEENAERFVTPPSSPEGANEPPQHHEKADQDYTSEGLR